MRNRLYRTSSRGVFLVLLTLLFLFTFIVKTSGDIIFPKRTSIIFNQNGHPYKHPVSFRLVCHGKSKRMNSIQLKNDTSENELHDDAIEVQVKCQEYPCITNNPFYDPKERFIDIKRCDIIGVMDGKPFTINNYSKSLGENVRCDPRWFDQNGKECKMYTGHQICAWVINLPGK